MASADTMVRPGMYRRLLASSLVAKGGTLPFAAGMPSVLACWMAQLGGRVTLYTFRTGGRRKLRILQSGAWRSGESDDLETLQAALSVRLGT